VTTLPTSCFPENGVTEMSDLKWLRSCAGLANNPEFSPLELLSEMEFTWSDMWAECGYPPRHEWTATHRDLWYAGMALFCTSYMYHTSENHWPDDPETGLFNPEHKHAYIVDELLEMWDDASDTLELKSGYDERTITTTWPSAQDYVLLRVDGIVKPGTLSKWFDIMCVEKVTETDPVPSDEDAQYGWRTVFYVKTRTIDLFMSECSSAGLKLV
jgi:hypothetical protein